MDTQIVVVGAGPVGLMLAGELRLGGAEVIVLERRDRPATESRASTLHARTMEILASRGLRSAFGTLPHEPRGHFGGIPMDLTLPSRFPGQWKVPQTRTEELLGQWAAGLGAEVRRGWEVRSVTDDGGQVTVEAETPAGVRTLRAAYLVACDGQDSTVRRLIGAEFPGRSATREMLRADVRRVDIPNRRFERLDRGMVVAARNPEGITRVMVHEYGRDVPVRSAAPEFSEITDVWKRVTGEDISTGEPVWVNAFDDTNRQLSRYRHGRVLFAGDAAHVQLPIGGQALNLGLQDAVNLGWKLAAQVRQTAPEGLLDTYHDERHEVGRRVLANIRAQAKLLLDDASVEPLRSLLAELVAAEHNRALLAGMISGLDVRYPAGPDDHPAVGTRVTDLDQRDGRGLLLAVPGSPFVRLAQPWADRVGTVPLPPLFADAAAVLVRPDGHIAWAGYAAGAARTALSRWFGPPATRAGDVTSEGGNSSEH
ncbi:FAD-dependent monooxygenase [Micromonospora sp. KC606]|uniref:FAD-dependent monooxygenase n=1 Tax=Micromonospora sp. KC606 TaxID=2530379 RepID=UPI00140469F3|nr:FAD-dependent monooxygenase [Micromonospora sp. KC606]